MTAPTTTGPTHGVWRSLIDMSLPHRRSIAVVVGLQVVQTAASLLLPTLNAGIVDEGIVAGDTGYVVTHGAAMLGVALVQVVGAAMAVYLGARIAMAIGRDVRAATFDQVQRFSDRELRHFGTASLVTRTTNDADQVQMLVLLALTVAAAAPITAAGGATLALAQDVPLSIVLFAAVPILVTVVGLLIRALIPASRAMQGRIDIVNRVMREHITGIRVIRAFVRDRHEQRRFGDANAELTATALRMGRITAFFGASAGLVSNLSAIAVVWIGGHRLASGSIELGSLLAFLSYVALTLTAVMMAMGVIVQAPRAKVSAERIFEVLRTEPTVAPPARSAATRSRGRGAGLVEVAGAAYGYPGAEAPVLHDVDLIAVPGQTTAIVGSTGSGKTTLVSLVPRLIDVDAGRVSIDGVDVRELDRATIAATVGLVPQSAYLFSGTVASNLRFARPDATDGELWHALEIAQAGDFVTAMPAGLATPIGQGGGTVSGGQRQRLAIARALVARPPVYVFDDAFSALDAATDARLRAALAAEVGDATIIVVASRVTTIRDADRIVVLERGHVTGAGTHDELITTNETYAEIVTSQLELDALEEVA